MSARSAGREGKDIRSMSESGAPVPIETRGQLRCGVKASGKVLCVFLLAFSLFFAAEDGWAQSIGKVKANPAPKQDKAPADLAPEQVDGYLAGLSDEQARRMLAAELKEKATAKSGKKSREQIGGKDRGLALGFYAAQSALSGFSDRISEVVAAAQSSVKTGSWEKLVGGKGIEQFLKAIALLALIVLLGLAVERLLLRKTHKLGSRLLEEVPRGGWEKTGVFFSRLTVDLLGLGIYALVTFLAYFLFYGREQPAYLVSGAIVVSYYFRLIETAARSILSPGAPELRPALMTNSDARSLYNWIVLTSASVLPLSALALALQKSEAGFELFLLVYSAAGPCISVLLALMILRFRRRVAGLIAPEGAQDSVPPSSFRRGMAEYWHYPAIFFVLAVGAYWWARVLIHADATILGLLMSLFLVPLCIGLDQWLRQMLINLWREPREVIDFSTSDELCDEETTEPAKASPDGRSGSPDRNMRIYFPLIRRTFRLVLLVFLFFATLRLWAVDFDVGWVFARSVLGGVIALVLGLVVWEVVKARIDRKIEEETPLQSDETEEEGTGGSRSRTLLMLLRKFILAFLFVVVGFSVLASLGVNIAPLLAGAGVVGLAIGFGSQTLVKDIIAGIFFLIDDAFRVGDYVEAGTAKGTVEHISLRSLRLRHPRGQIFVVPFGELKMVQNFTRDYIIEKLDIRVRFDTEPDVIRKIVKSINKEIGADEDYAGVLLSDIKSVGVREMDDSAMIMRVKFKCIPGEQYALRREVFHRLQKAFKEKGIEFAHRNVTVYLPQQTPPTGGSESATGPDRSLEAAGAAAAAAVAQAEAEALARAAEKKSKE